MKCHKFIGREEQGADGWQRQGTTSGEQIVAEGVFRVGDSRRDEADSPCWNSLGAGPRGGLHHSEWIKKSEKERIRQVWCSGGTPAWSTFGRGGHRAKTWRAQGMITQALQCSSQALPASCELETWVLWASVCPVKSKDFGETWVCRGLTATCRGKNYQSYWTSKKDRRKEEEERKWHQCVLRTL